MARYRRRTTTRYAAPRRRTARSAMGKPRRRATRRRASPRAQRLVIQLVGLPAGSMVSTATLGKKSGRPVRARY
jgi:hypothetical protein